MTKPKAAPEPTIYERLQAVLQVLIAERRRVHAQISHIEAAMRLMSGVPHTALPPKGPPTPKPVKPKGTAKVKWTHAQRAAQSRRLREHWAKRRAEAAKAKRAAEAKK